ncbi:MAG: tryptophan 7-halogenase, partial [Myxococcales bacterium]|nr:tryptophan 7-halogenase [Myxococcales bacterium]
MGVEKRDCIVIGGGPAGSTFATIVKKYAPELKVTVLDRDRHPRYHIGESTIPVINGVFRDLELFDTLYDGRFVRKVGITFVWGRNRSPWNADYLQIGDYCEDDRGVINVVGQDFSALMRTEMRRDFPLSAINVRRDRFDHLLLENARKFGAEVREGTKATGVLRDENGAITAVDWSDDQGSSGRIETPFVLDAAGMGGFVTRGQREYDPQMANFAVAGYFSGADWKVLYRGSHEATTVFIASVPMGWIWYIPIEDDLMSVGVVTHTAHFRDRLKSVDLLAFFWECVEACPEVAPLLKNATLRDDVLPNGRRVAAHRDWSSWAREPVGPGYAAAGDAAIFVDPILASGVTLAMQSGHRAAYTFNTARHRPADEAAQLWRAYADYVRGEAGSFLTLARYAYGNDCASDSWWWQAQRLVNSGGQIALDEQQAFTMATAGFFPTPRAISLEIMAPFLRGLLGTEADLYNVYHEDGVGDDAALLAAELRVRTPFRLALRAEPDLKTGGRLELYHDLVADDFAFAHRHAAAPCKMAPALAPIVAALPRYARVVELVDAAPTLLPLGFAAEDDIRR